MSAPRLSIMPGWVFTDDRFKPMDIKILGMLGRHIDKGGWCTRSQVKLAKEMGIARSTVQASLTRLCEIGVVQKRENQTADGRDCSHDWRVLLDVEPEDLPSWKGAGKSGDSDATPPADIPAPPAAISAPPADPMDRHPLPTHGPAPYKNDPLKTTLQEREREGAREASEEGEAADDGAKPDPATLPGRAAFEQRVMRFCTGEGYQGGEWPKFAGSTFSHIAKTFAALDEEDRQAAERWRDAFLAKAVAQGVKTPMPVANYFRDRAWRLLTDTEMARAMAAKDRGPAPASTSGVAEVSRPEGWAVGFGPVWAAAEFEVLLAGPDRPHPNPASPLWYPGLIRTNWPKLSALHSGRGFVAPERLHRMKELMEFVPEGGDVWAAWQAEARARGWPDWPRKDGMNGLYFPQGGPEGLAAFEQALAGQTSNHEAAE